MGKRRDGDREKELGFEKEVNSLGSKLISVIVSLAVVLGLALVPAVPVALAQPYVIGANVSPASQTVGVGSSFSVYLWVIDDVAQNYDTVAYRLTYNSSLVTATGVTPNPAFNWNLANGYNNNWDPANQTGLIYSDNAWLGNLSNVSMWACYINFTADSTNTGTSPLDFLPVEDINTTDVFLVGTGELDWSLVVNGTVTVASGTKCYVDTITGSGNVKIDGVAKGVGECSDTGELLDYTFILRAEPDAGWQFANWSPNVDLAVTTNPNCITVAGGGTEDISATFTELPPQADLDVDVLDFGTLVVGGTPANQTFNVTNIGGGQLNWTSDITYDGSNPNATWAGVSYDPTSGGPLGNGESELVEVAVNISGLTEAGRYNATIDVNDSVSVRVTFDLLGATDIKPCRNIILPGVTSGGQPYAYAGDFYTVWVNWTVCANDVDSVTLVDNSSVTDSLGARLLWDTVTQVSESPAADAKEVRGDGGTSVEYSWQTTQAADSSMSVTYTAQVPGTTAPGWYNMTIDNEDIAWIEYYIGETSYVKPITCNYSIYVAAPVYVDGTVWEVVWYWSTTHPSFTGGYQNQVGNLTLEGANVTLVDGDTYYNLTDGNGYYNVSVPPGTYTLTASLDPAFAPETYGVLNIVGDEGVITINFIGQNGLEPYDPFYSDNAKNKMAVSYVAKAVNCYLITPATMPAAALTLTEVGNVTAMWRNTP